MAKSAKGSAKSMFGGKQAPPFGSAAPENQESPKQVRAEKQAGFPAYTPASERGKKAKGK